MRGPQSRNVLNRIAFVVLLGTLSGLVGCEQDARQLLGWTQAVIDESGGRLTLKFVSMRETDIKLKRLDFQLGGTPIDIDGMIFTESDVTDRGLAFLGKVSSLSVLHFSNCSRVTDRGFASVVHNTDLEELSIVNTRCSDQGMAMVSKLSNLRRFSVSGLGDTGLAHISKLPRLRELTLIDCTINEAGVRALSRLPGLDTLELYRCQMLDSIEVAVKRGLPGCRIVVNSL